MADEKPDYVNDWPQWDDSGWHESEWPEGRCQYIFRHHGVYGSRDVIGRPCGYRAIEGQPVCIFHAEGPRDWENVARELTAASSMCMHEANLCHAQLDGALLQGARLLRASMQSVNLEHANADFADFTGANLTGARFAHTVLRRATLVDASLAEAEFFTDTDLDGVTWWLDRRSKLDTILHRNTPVLFGEPDKAPRRGEVDPRSLECFERVYRRIKQAYQNSGQYDRAGEFFIREMECKRKQSRSPVTRAIHRLMHFLCNYGENPWRVVGIGSFVVLFMAIVQGLVGVQVAPQSAFVVGPGLQWASAKEHLDAAIRAVYFSVMTFTATGYGDYVPRPGLGQVLAASEALCGVFLMALFLVCLARKYSRA